MSEPREPNKGLSGVCLTMKMEKETSCAFVCVCDGDGEIEKVKGVPCAAFLTELEHCGEEAEFG